MLKQNLANGDVNGRSQHTRPTLAAYNKERVQSVTTTVNHIIIQDKNIFGQQPTLTRKPSMR